MVHWLSASPQGKHGSRYEGVANTTTVPSVASQEEEGERFHELAYTPGIDLVSDGTRFHHTRGHSGGQVDDGSPRSVGPHELRALHSVQLSTTNHHVK